jgi:hypothetical protein
MPLRAVGLQGRAGDLVGDSESVPDLVHVRGYHVRNVVDSIML